MATFATILCGIVATAPLQDGHRAAVAPLEGPVAARVQRATALVLIPGASGSAFVVGTQGGRVLLVTNQHVLVPPRGMRPDRVSVVFDAGTPSESFPIDARVEGVDREADLALRAAGIFTSNCSRAHGASCWALSVMYAKGLGVERDHEKSRSLLRKACTLGHAQGCGDLWRVYGECLPP